MSIFFLPRFARQQILKDKILPGNTAVPGIGYPYNEEIVKTVQYVVIRYFILCPISPLIRAVYYLKHSGWPRKPDYQIPWHFHDFSLTFQADSRVYANIFSAKKHGLRQFMHQSTGVPLGHSGPGGGQNSNFPFYPISFISSYVVYN